MSRETLVVEPLTTIVTGQWLDMDSNVFLTVRAIHKPPSWHGPRGIGGSGVGVQADHGLVSWASAWQIIKTAGWDHSCWDSNRNRDDRGDLWWVDWHGGGWLGYQACCWWCHHWGKCGRDWSKMKISGFHHRYQWGREFRACSSCWRSAWYPAARALYLACLFCDLICFGWSVIQEQILIKTNLRN